MNESSEAFLLEKDPPIVVYVSEKEAKDDKWGIVQFPVLNHLKEGRLLLSFQAAEDTAKSYGEGSHKYYISEDNGRQWQEIGEEERVRYKAFAGLSINSETIISVETLKARSVKDISLPSEPFTWIPYDYTYSQPEKGYRFDDLPDQLKSIAIRHTNPSTGESIVDHAPISLLGDFRMATEGLLPVIFFGPLKRMRDGAILGVFYPSFAVTKEGEIDTKDGVLLVLSKNNGKTWQQWDRLPYRPDLGYDPKAYLRGGYTEPCAEILNDGSLLFAMRTADATPEPFPGWTECGPLYTVKRSIEGEWTIPKPVSPYGVLPQLLKLKNGMTVLSYGRPGIEVRLSFDNGETWTAPYPILEATRLDQRAETCGYSSIIEDLNDPNAFWITYSSFINESREKKNHKTILVQHCKIRGPFKYPATPPIITGQTDQIIEHKYPGKEQTAIRMRFCKSKLHGVTEGFYKSGVPSFKTPYFEGSVHGVQTFYAPEGYLMRTVPFDKGEIHGVMRHFDKNGNILQERHYWQDTFCTQDEFFEKSEKLS